MNPIMKFYAAVLAYLNADVEVEGAIEKIEVLAREVPPSWGAFSINIKALEKIVNHSDRMTPGEYDESEIQEDFVVAAFKDLSVLKNPAAMGLFRKLRDRVLVEGDMFVWARAIKRRPDGSAVVILHVSDYERFAHIIEHCNMVKAWASSGQKVEGCVVIHS